MKNFQTEYQGVILHILINEGAKKVDEIIEIYKAKKYSVSADDYKQNNKTRNGECKFEQRIRNHLRAARRLLSKDYVKVKDGKYNVTAKGKKYFSSTFSTGQSSFKPSIVSLKKVDTHGLNSLLKNWYEEGVRQFIFAGPPGTGKTLLAKNILNDGIFLGGDVPADYRDSLDKLSTLLQFHPSYSYEEFIEGIQPSQNSKDELVFTIKRGPFWKMCALAMNESVILNRKEDFLEIENYKISHLLNIDSVHVEILHKNKDGVIEHIYDYTQSEIGKRVHFKLPTYVEDSQYFLRLREPLFEVSSVNNQYKIEKNEDYEFFEGLDSDVRDVWLLNKNFEIVGQGKVTIESGVLLDCNMFEGKNTDLEIVYSQIKEPFYLLIDEVNRANVTEVFGELLVQLEYRLGNSLSTDAQLSHSGDILFVPDNLVLIATMNNTDQSLMRLDKALMRRFHIVDLSPSPEVLVNRKVEKIELDKLLQALNYRLAEIFGFSKGNQVGHSYFIKLPEDAKIESLKRVWFFEIMPLVAEFANQDSETIQETGLFPGSEKANSNVRLFNSISDDDFEEHLDNLIQVELSKQEVA